MKKTTKQIAQDMAELMNKWNGAQVIESDCFYLDMVFTGKTEKDANLIKAAFEKAGFEKVEIEENTNRVWASIPDERKAV